MTKITRLNILRLGVVWFELNYQYFLSISFCPSLVSHLAASFSHSSPLRPSLSTIMYLVSERQTIMYFEPEKAIRSRGCPGSTADGGLTLMTYVRLQRLNWLTSSVLSKTRLSIYNSNKDTFILIAHVLFTHWFIGWQIGVQHENSLFSVPLFDGWWISVQSQVTAHHPFTWHTNFTHLLPAAQPVIIIIIIVICRMNNKLDQNLIVEVHALPVLLDYKDITGTVSKILSLSTECKFKWKAPWKNRTSRYISFFSTHHSMVFYFRCSVYWWKGSVRF